MATSTEISFGLFDVTAKPDSTPSCPDKQPFIDIDQLKLDAVTAPTAATLEHNYWLLDGTFEAFPDEPATKTWGLWSETMANGSQKFTKRMPPTPPTFTRPSTAYLADGTSVLTNAPRYEDAVFDKGLMLEQGTVNLLTENQSNGGEAGDTTGFNRMNLGTMTASTEKAWEGSYSIKYIPPNVQALEGVYTSSCDTYPSTLYTVLAHVYGSGSVKIGLDERDSSDVRIGSIYWSDPITLSSEWQEIYVSKKVSATCVKIRIVLVTDIQQSATFYADGFKLSQGVKTSWHIGGGTRSPETLLIPSADVFNNSEGTIELQYIPKRTAGTLKQVLFDTLSADPLTNLQVYVHTDGKLRMEYGNGTAITTLTSTTTLAKDTAYAIALKWGTAGAELLINGASEASSAVVPVLSAGTNVQLGSTVTLTNIVTNGDFSDGTTGWNPVGGTVTASNNTLSLTGDGTVSEPSIAKTTSSPCVSGNNIYVTVSFKSTDESCNKHLLQIRGSSSGAKAQTVQSLDYPPVGSWYKLSGIVTLATNIIGNIIIYVNNRYVDSATANGKIMEVQDVRCYDLTAIFGAGNEPTTTEMDAILNQNNITYHDGSQIMYISPDGIIDDLRISNVARTNAAILAGYSSGVALAVDEYTTYKLGLNGSLQSDDVDFAVAPVLTVDFNNNHSSMGVSFEFDPHGNNYPNSINIKWYGSGGTVLLADEDFSPDDWRYTALRTVENYDKLVITFNSMTVPYRYLKLQKINYGKLRKFGVNEVIEANILEEINPISAELPISTLTFRLHSPDAEFNILNPAGIYTLLQQRQPLDVIERVNGAAKPMGTFYLDTWEGDSENTFGMGAVAATGIMDGTTYRGGMYSGTMAATLMADILTDAGFGYDIDSSYAAVPVYGWLPILSYREALQQVVFAIGAVVDTSRSDIVKIYPLPTTTTGTITKDRKFTGGGVKLRGLVTGVEVTGHTYVAGTVAVELFNGALTAGEHEISFSEPAHDLSITGATILASNCNYALVDVSSPGTVILAGQKYVDTTQIVGVYMGSLPAGSKENILKVEEATLVSGANASAVANRVYAYYQRRIEQSVSMVLGIEQIGQKWGVETLYDETKAGTIESLNIDLTGGYRAKVVIVGE